MGMPPEPLAILVLIMVGVGILTLMAILGVSYYIGKRIYKIVKEVEE